MGYTLPWYVGGSGGVGLGGVDNWRGTDAINRAESHCWAVSDDNTLSISNSDSAGLGTAQQCAQWQGGGRTRRPWLSCCFSYCYSTRPLPSRRVRYRGGVLHSLLGAVTANARPLPLQTATIHIEGSIPRKVSGTCGFAVALIGTNPKDTDPSI